jgi:hypothetical protein
MSEYIRLYDRQNVDASLFRVENAAGKLVLRADLKQNACAHCGKFDEMKALHDGSYNRFSVKTNQDFLGSWDLFPIVSVRMRQFLEAIVGNSVKYFETGSSDYFIALPTHAILPDATCTSFRALNKCPLCGRFSELLWGPTPTGISSPITVGVFHLENRIGITPLWVVSKELSTALSKAMPKFKGIFKDPLTNVVDVKK